MPWNGSGTYSLPAAYSPEVNGTIIDAVRYNGLTTDVASGITNALAKDGQNVPTANLPMSGFKHTGAAAANAAGQYLLYGQSSALLTTLLLEPGTAGAPSLAFNGDTNNGWWSPAADTQAWSLAGAEALRLSSVGLGLGITPTVFGGAAKTLHIHDTGTLAELRLTNGTSGSGSGQGGIVQQQGNDLYLWNGENSFLSLGTNNLERVRINAGGDLGIGLTSPLNRLHVAAGAGSAILRFSDTTPTTLGFLGSGSGIISSAGASDFGLRAEANLVFASNGNNERARITSAGLLLINRTSDSGLGRMQVDSASSANVADFAASGGSAFLNVRSAAAATAGIRIAGNAGTVGTNSLDIQQDSAGAVDIVQRANARMSWYTNNTERLRINADGSMYGTALHNVGTPTGTTTQYIASGTYAPTVTAISNVSGTTPLDGQWIRVGNVVTLSGSTQITTTAGGGATTSFRVSLPIASNLVAASDLSGSAVSPLITAQSVSAHATDEIQVSGTANAAGTGNVYWSVTYEVLA